MRARPPAPGRLGSGAPGACTRAGFELELGRGGWGAGASIPSVTDSWLQTARVSRDGVGWDEASPGSGGACCRPRGRTTSWPGSALGAARPVPAGPEPRPAGGCRPDSAWNPAPACRFREQPPVVRVWTWRGKDVPSGQRRFRRGGAASRPRAAQARARALPGGLQCGRPQAPFREPGRLAEREGAGSLAVLQLNSVLERTRRGLRGLYWRCSCHSCPALGVGEGLSQPGTRALLSGFLWGNAL